MLNDVERNLNMFKFSFNMRSTFVLILPTVKYDECVWPSLTSTSFNIVQQCWKVLNKMLSAFGQDLKNNNTICTVFMDDRWTFVKLKPQKNGFWGPAPTFITLISVHHIYNLFFIFVSADFPIEGQSGTMQATWCGWLAGWLADWLGLLQSRDRRISYGYEQRS